MKSKIKYIKSPIYIAIISVAAFILFFSVNPVHLSSQVSNQYEYGRFLYTPTTTPISLDLNTVSSTAYIVTKMDGTIVLAKNIDVQYPIASITKLMTAIVAKENINLSKVTTVSERATWAFGDSGQLRKGDRLIIGDLLYPLLISSSNDAAEVISESIGTYNSRQNFVNLMNTKARSIGMASTTFADPSGLSVGNLSTPRDIEILLRYINQKYPELLNITTIEGFDFKKYQWSNNSSLMMIDGYMMGKTGFTTPAKETAAGIFLTKTKNNAVEPLNYIILQSGDRNTDIEILRNYIEKTVK